MYSNDDDEHEDEVKDKNVDEDKDKDEDVDVDEDDNENMHTLNYPSRNPHGRGGHVSAPNEWWRHPRKTQEEATGSAVARSDLDLLRVWRREQQVRVGEPFSCPHAC